MYISEHTIIVHQPIEVVFKNITCLSRTHRWSTLVHTAEKLDDGPLREGMRFRHVGSFMDIETEAIQVIKRYKPPYEFVFGDTHVTLLPIENHYVLSEVPEGTKVHLTMKLIPRDARIGQFAAKLIIARLQKHLDQDLLTFKSLIEAGVTVHA